MNPIATLIADQIQRWHIPGEALIVGICGTQASGKSTASAQVVEHLTDEGLNIGMIGLDDLYLGRSTRAELAAHVHPLFATRGPPGTHDVALGLTVLDAVRRGDAVRLPRFDKRADEPVAEADWQMLAAKADVLLFEGWCVGARPQTDAELMEPTNALEREEDPEGVWRRAYNAHLAGPTGELFARIDRLIYLRPPGFEIVRTWRSQQERAYIATDRPEGAPAAMSDDQLLRFIAHYERMTRHMIATMPDYADMVIALDADRAVLASTVRA
jgi:D-glycerate 3-kinase